MTPDKDIPYPVLISDIGGTNTRFALIESIGSPIERLPDIKTGEHPSLEDAIEEAVYARTALRPRSAIMALAGPVVGERIEMTNAKWVIEPTKTLARFALEEMILLNDFVAASLSLPDLTADDLEPIGQMTWGLEGARAIVGPGTGLGTGALIRGRQVWVPVPGEGGHIDFGPVSARDFAIWPYLEKAHGRISAETVLSGPGLVRLYRAICASDGIRPALTSPTEITGAGLEEADGCAAEALALFATYLGRMAGNIALVFMARGGVFLAGGIPAKIASVIHSGAFRDAFLDKEPHRDILEAIPTAIIINDNPALAGVAAYARKPSRFAIDLVARQWRKSP